MGFHSACQRCRQFVSRFLAGSYAFVTSTGVIPTRERFTAHTLTPNRVDGWLAAYSGTKCLAANYASYVRSPNPASRDHGWAQISPSRVKRQIGRKVDFKRWISSLTSKAGGYRSSARSAAAYRDVRQVPRHAGVTNASGSRHRPTQCSR